MQKPTKSPHNLILESILNDNRTNFHGTAKDKKLKFSTYDSVILNLFPYLCDDFCISYEEIQNIVHQRCFRFFRQMYGRAIGLKAQPRRAQGWPFRPNAPS